MRVVQPDEYGSAYIYLTDGETQSAKTIKKEVLLDLNEDNQIISIEFLNLNYQLGEDEDES